MRVYVDPADPPGHRRSPTHHYLTVLPGVVVRWRRVDFLVRDRIKEGK